MSYRDDLALKIATYTGERMVALAYEAMIENLEDAKKTITNNNYRELCDKIEHNREIIAHLIATMGDQDDEFSLTTKELYLYVNKLMTDGVNKKDALAFDEAIKILIPLKDGWKELSEKLYEENANKTPHTGVYSGMTYNKDDISIYSDSKEWEKG